MTYVVRSGGQVLAWVGQTRYAASCVIEDVAEVVDQRVQRRIADASRVARCLRDLASHSGQIMNINFDEMRSGPWFPGMYRELLGLCRTMERFDATFRAFAHEHRVLVDDATMMKVEALRAWCAALPPRLEPLWNQYLRDLDAGLSACKEEEESAASEWAATDTDGWPNESET